MKPYSDRRRKRDSNYQQARRDVWARAGGQCEVNAVGCSWTMDAVHHVAGRNIPDPHRLSNLLGCCLGCHTKIHENPAWARDRGFMQSRLGTVTPPAWVEEDAS